MKIRLYSVIIGLAAGISAQAQNYEWAFNVGGSGVATTRSVAIGSDGSVYSTGNFTGNSDFDQGASSVIFSSPGAFGQNDIFVQKSDSNGNFLWAKQFGAGTHDQGYGIAVDPNQNIIITGDFEGTVDFDPGTGVHNLVSQIGTRDIFILKLRPNGDFVWAKQIKTTNDSRGNSIFTDDKGSVYTSGFFQGSSTDFNPGAGTYILHSGGTYTLGGFIQKLDSNGDFKWAKALVRYTGAGSSVITQTKLSPSGHLYSTGYFTGRVDFDPNTPTSFITSTGARDIFIHKMDTAGNFDWVKTIGSTSDENSNAIAVDWQDNVFITGDFMTSLDFDPGAGTFSLSTNLAGGNPRDIFIQKLDSSGNFLWAKKMGKRDSDIGYGLTTDPVGNVYNTGIFSETTDFDPSFWGTATLTHVGMTDVYLQKLAPNGDFIWATSIGAASVDYGFDVVIDDKFNIYTAGQFYGTADFNPSSSVTNNLNSSTYQDGFVQKLSQCIAVKSADTNTTCGSFLWNGTTYTESNNTAVKRLSTSSGCDSLVFLNLTIDTVVKSVTVSGITITATLSGATYQWVNCNTSYSLISGATNRSYTPATNGNYACIVNDGGCSDTSACVSINSVGLEEYEQKKLSVYPNPVNDRLTIELDENQFVQLDIMDISGKIVMSSNEFNSTITMSNLTKGMYVIRVTTSNGIKIGKFIKN